MKYPTRLFALILAIVSIAFLTLPFRAKANSVITAGAFGEVFPHQGVTTSAPIRFTPDALTLTLVTSDSLTFTLPRIVLPLAQLPAIPAATVTAPDPTAPALPSGTAGQILVFITPIISLLVTGLVKKYGPDIPGYLVPVIATGIGLATNLITAYATGHPSNWLLGLALGASATTLHQIGSQLTDAVKNSQTPA